MPAVVLGAALLARLAHLLLVNTGGTVLGREDRRARQAQRLGARVAEDALGAGVPAGDQAAQVEGDDGVVAHAVGYHAQATLLGAEPLLGVAAGGDVDEGEHGAVDAVL